MIKLSIDKMTDVSFKGTISDECLTDSQLKALGLVRDGEVEVNISGDYWIETYDEHPYPVIEFILVEHKDKWIELDLLTVDLKDIEYQLKQLNQYRG